MNELIELKNIFGPAYIDKEIKNFESFFRSVFIRVSKTNEPLEALYFCNFYTNRCLFLTRSDVEYSISRATIQIIEYINFVISLFAKIMNSTFKIDSYYICAHMFEFIKNNYTDNCNETILEFLEKKYPDIKFFKNNEFGLGYPEKLLISKI